MTFEFIMTKIRQTNAPTKLRLDAKLIRAQLGEETNVIHINRRIIELQPGVTIISLWSL